MKRVRLYAYLEYNLGDDIMVETLLTKYSSTRFYCFELNRPYETFTQKKNFITKYDIWKRYGRINHIANILTFHKHQDWLINSIINRLLHKIEASVYIGGSLFQEKVFAPQSYKQTADRLNFGPLYIIGANFGKYYSQSFFEFFYNYFSKCKSVVFRDKKSYSLFSSLNHISYAPDVVFNYSNTFSSVKDNSVIISVLDFYRRDSLCQYGEQYDTLITNLCKYLIDNNRRPVLFSFCSGEGDETAADRIWSKLSLFYQNKTEKVYYKGNINNALSLFCKAQYVISTRFHSMILAMKFRIPFFCIAYDDKIVNVLNDLNYTNYCTPNNLYCQKMEDMLNSKVDFGSLSSYESQASKQFSDFDIWISKKT